MHKALNSPESSKTCEMYFGNIVDLMETNPIERCISLNDNLPKYFDTLLSIERN
jgi:hypothetical protein